MVSSVCFHFYSLKPLCHRFLILNSSGISQLAMIGSTVTRATVSLKKDFEKVFLFLLPERLAVPPPGGHF